MRIALFGGSFDPPHLGHFQVTEALLGRSVHTAVVDQVWYVPVKLHEFGKDVSSSQVRTELLQLQWQAHHTSIRKRVRVEDYELQQPGVTYSYHTLCHFAELLPRDEFSFVIGSDNVATFPKWFRYQELLQQFPVYVYPRAGYPLAQIRTALLPGMVPLQHVPEVAVSSTQIRQHLQAGESVAGLVVPAIAAYLQPK